MKRTLCALFALLLAAACARAEPEVAARGAILMDRETGRVLYEQNADERLPMASTTKIMTALLALESCAMDEPVTASQNASGVPGTSIYLSPGETLSMREMLLGLMLRSGNDAAVAIAEHVSGDVDAFCARMNERAAALGADAAFFSPNGLDEPGHGASARAMALIAREAMAREDFRALVSTRRATIPWKDHAYQRVLVNKNRLLTDFEGATGIKTGFTSLAGRCLVFSAKRGEAEYVGALLNCPSWFDTAEALLDWAFSAYDTAVAADEGDAMGFVAVRGGRETQIAALAAQALRAPIREGDAWRVKIELPDSIPAPVRAGDALGEARLEVNGETLAVTPLVAESASARFTFADALMWSFRRWALGAL